MNTLGYYWDLLVVKSLIGSYRDPTAEKHGPVPVCACMCLGCGLRVSGFIHSR